MELPTMGEMDCVSRRTARTRHVVRKRPNARFLLIQIPPRP
jgi:hypothetical protein